ncbi:MAG TPA: tRNA pseudouridine(38-40) synthase TruA [Desulfobacteraceae bacterium]|nr:tRNA pseudouridine(38-40) synthase TruA [Desulfobacteraceae bacterium]HPJ67716.1 tRNA pseudouridine(38-40) synthase TruA [Desulfobacteraceae bacterium]HPQ29704.1 tRNA pseudouridine(38-40) synthase TruA [Desulfobacteraceae bacterium]
MVYRNIRLIMSYDGSNYHGWQRQKNSLSIQEVVEEKIRMITREPVRLIASGRTDTGVHAINQTCNFMTQSDIGTEAIKKGLNSLLPEDILIKSAEYAPHDFHARISAKSKIYEYRILNREQPDLFRRKYVWHIRRPLDHVKMSECLGKIMGKHDFSSFKSSGSGVINSVRSIIRAELQRTEKHLLFLIFEADGFLRHMVRNIVGTVVDAGLGKISPGDFKGILESKDRTLARFKAPAGGLFLMEVKY